MKIAAILGDILFEDEKEYLKDTLVEAVKSGSDLRGANLSGSYLRDADLSGANLSGADLSGANLSCSYLSGADLGGANLGDANLRDADLSGANLGCSNFRDAYLRCSNFRDADLSGADLSGANLSGADLGGANLGDANLSGADLRDADLGGSYLRGTYLGGSYLGGSYLRGADLRCADLSGAVNIPYIPFACPSEGSFTAWKKVDRYLIELKIPSDARRSSATTEKCRCDKAKVISIIDINTNEQLLEVVNKTYTDTTYKVGEMVYPDAFDEDRFNECSNGIHFFIDKQLAINY